MARARLCAAALGTVSLLAAAPARAQSGATLVAIVTAEPNASLTRRVQAELQGVGLDVIVLKPPEEASASRAPLEQAARGVGAIAAVRLIPSGAGRVEVWVADRVTGKAVVRELDAPESGASDAAVAVASVELLRASLMELHSGEPPRGDVPASDAVKALALPGARTGGDARLGLEVGGGAELGVRGLGASADADLGVSIRVAPRVGARLIGHMSLGPAHTETAPGGVDVQSQLLGAMASLALADASSAWQPSLSVGVAAVHVSTTGTAATPYVSASEDAWAAAPVAGIGLAWAFARDLRIRGDGLGAWALPAIRVHTPAGDAGWWGQPAVIVSLGLEVLWAP